MQQPTSKRQQKIADINRHHLKDCDLLMLLLCIFSYFDSLIVVFSMHLYIISNTIKILMLNQILFIFSLVRTIEATRHSTHAEAVLVVCCFFVFVI